MGVTSKVLRTIPFREPDGANDPVSCRCLCGFNVCVYSAGRNLAYQSTPHPYVCAQTARPYVPRERSRNCRKL